MEDLPPCFCYLLLVYLPLFPPVYMNACVCVCEGGHQQIG